MFKDAEGVSLDGDLPRVVDGCKVNTGIRCIRSHRQLSKLKETKPAFSLLLFSFCV